MKPLYWVVIVDGARQSKPYYQRAAARGAAIILRAQGHTVDVEPVFRT